MKKGTPKRKATLASIGKSIDGLARITKHGFDNTVSNHEFAGFKGKFTEFKDDMSAFKKNAELTLYNVDRKLQTVDERLDAIEKTLGPLVQVSSVMEKEIRNLNTRVSKLELRAGMR